MKKTAEEVIVILKQVFITSGYSIDFENVSIDLKDNHFTIKGNK